MTLNAKMLALIAGALTIIVLTIVTFQRNKARPDPDRSEIADILREARVNDTAAVKKWKSDDDRNHEMEIAAAARRIKFSGTYVIELKGYKGSDSELFTLNPNGTSIWEWRTGGSKRDQKFGTWEATDKSITITTNGRSGPIVDTFVLKNGRLVHPETSDRYLRKIY